MFLIHLTSHCSLLFANWKTNEICWQFMRKTRSQLSFARWNLCNTTKKSIQIYLNYEIHLGMCVCVCVCRTLKCNAGQTRQCNQQQEVLSKHCAWHYLAPLPLAPYPPPLSLHLHTLCHSTETEVWHKSKFHFSLCLWYMRIQRRMLLLLLLQLIANKPTWHTRLSE